MLFYNFIAAQYQNINWQISKAMESSLCVVNVVRDYENMSL